MPAVLRHPDSSSKTKKTVALSLASFTSTCLNVILQMLIVRCFDKQEVAVYMQSILIYNTLLPFLQLGVNNGLYYCLTQREHESQEVMIEGMFLVGLTGLLVSFFILLGGNLLLADFMKNEALNVTSFWLIPYILICVPESLTFVGFVYFNRIRFVAYYNAFKTFICLLILVVGTQLTGSGIVLFVMRVISGCFFGLCSIYLLYKFVMPQNGVKICLLGVKEIVAVSLPLSIATMAGTLSANLDLWIISGMLTPEEFSIFRMGSYELPIVGIVTGAVSTVVTVDMNKAGKRGDIAGALAIFKKVAKKTSMFIMPCMIFFLFASKEFICWLFTEEYVEAIPVFILYLLYLPIRCVLYGPLFVALGKSQVVMLRELISLILNAMLSVLAVRYMGMIGAALSTLVVTYLYSVPCNLYLLAKWSGVPWYNILPFGHIGKCILLSVPGACLGWGMLYHSTVYSHLLRLIIMSMVFIVVTILLYWRYFNLSSLKLWKDLR